MYLAQTVVEKIAPFRDIKKKIEKDIGMTLECAQKVGEDIDCKLNMSQSENDIERARQILRTMKESYLQPSKPYYRWLLPRHENKRQILMYFDDGLPAVAEIEHHTSTNEVVIALYGFLTNDCMVTIDRKNYTWIRKKNYRVPGNISLMEDVICIYTDKDVLFCYSPEVLLSELGEDNSKWILKKDVIRLIGRIDDCIRYNMAKELPTKHYDRLIVMRKYGVDISVGFVGREHYGPERTCYVYKITFGDTLIEVERNETTGEMNTRRVNVPEPHEEEKACEIIKTLLNEIKILERISNIPSCRERSLGV